MNIIDQTFDLITIGVEVESDDEAYSNQPSIKHDELWKSFMVGLLENQTYFENHPAAFEK